MQTNHSAAARLAVYARVSSDEQRENQTIDTQVNTAERWLELQTMMEKPLETYKFYLDNGVSGTIALSDRPAGSELLRDAQAGYFNMVIVYKIDRLGRDPRDILNIAHELMGMGVAVKSLTEEFDLSSPTGRFMFNVLAASAGFARDSHIERSIEGTNYWAKEGVWLGGIVPYGYRVEGKKKQARLVVSDVPVDGIGISESGVVKMVYRLLAEDGWSCVKIAEHLNTMGVPPAYTKDRREVLHDGPEGKRKKATSGFWRPGRVRSMVVNPVYKGQHNYGKRSAKERDIIVRAVPEIVDETTWEKAQETLRANILIPADSAKGHYLLRGLIKCGLCGLNMHGTGVKRPSGKTDVYYRCNGKIPFRHRSEGLCPSKRIAAKELEEAIWNDIITFRDNPGPILEKLAESLRGSQVEEQKVDQEREMLASAVAHKQDERDSILDLYRHKTINLADLETQLDKITREEASLKERLAELDHQSQEEATISARLMDAQTMLEELRAQSKDDYSWEEKREIIELLVLEVVVRPPEDGEHRHHVTVTYVFDGGSFNRRGRGSGQPPT